MRAVDPSDLLIVARIAFGGAVAYSAVALWRAVRSRIEPEQASRDLDELWRRYEQGEISWDEYETLSRDLEE